MSDPFNVILQLKMCLEELLVCVLGGGAGYNPGGGAASFQLQDDHLLLRPAAAAALLQRCRKDWQTATHLGAHVHVRGGGDRLWIWQELFDLCSDVWYIISAVLSCRIMYRELKDSDKEKESGKMVSHWRKQTDSQEENYFIILLVQFLQPLNRINDHIVTMKFFYLYLFIWI